MHSDGLRRWKRPGIFNKRMKVQRQILVLRENNLEYFYSSSPWSERNS